MALDNTNVNKLLIVLGGPTAVGKTALAIKVAQYFDTEILSADSRQFYKEINIGTAKPSKDELSQVKHHFVNNLSIFDQYDVGRYQKEALAALSHIFKSQDIAVLVGGSGLFIKAVCDGFDEIPKASPETRERLNKMFKEKGIKALQVLVQEHDPTYFAQVDQKNPARLIRALEVIESSGQPFSSFRNRKSQQRDFDVAPIALDIEREKLYSRIDLRMDQMIEKGLFKEAGELLPNEHLNSLQTVGYREVFGYVKGEYDKEEAIRLLKRNSRRYAKRQLTWFRKDQRFEWFDPKHFDQIIAHILGKLHA